MEILLLLLLWCVKLLSDFEDVLLVHDSDETSENVELVKSSVLWHGVWVLEFLGDLLGNLDGFLAGIEVILSQWEWKEWWEWGVLGVWAFLVEFLAGIGVA